MVGAMADLTPEEDISYARQLIPRTRLTENVYTRPSAGGRAQELDRQMEQLRTGTPEMLEKVEKGEGPLKGVRFSNLVAPGLTESGARTRHAHSTPTHSP